MRNWSLQNENKEAKERESDGTGGQESEKTRVKRISERQMKHLRYENNDERKGEKI